MSMPQRRAPCASNEAARWAVLPGCSANECPVLPPRAGFLRRSAILVRTIGQAVPEPDFNCLMVRSRLQHHVCLDDSIDERACIDLLRARRVVVNVETGEPIKHCFLCGISGDGREHGFPIQAAFTRMCAS